MYTVRSDVESCNYETEGDKEVTDFLDRSCVYYTHKHDLEGAWP